MRLLEPTQLAALRSHFLPDRPGPLVGLHAIHTGNGAACADRWPDPRALAVRSASNCALSGSPDALDPDASGAWLQGLVDAPPRFEALLRRAAPELAVWDRVVLALPGAPRPPASPPLPVRRLEASDAFRVWALSPEDAWIADTWGGPAALAASGFAWGAFDAGVLVAVAASFFVGAGFEDIGVVTAESHRGRGLSGACADRLARDIRERGRTPSWTTSPDNQASLAVARKLGFERDRDDCLYVIGQRVPEPPRRPDAT